MSSRVLITNTTKKPFPKVFFDAIKNEVLGASYELSVAIVGEKRIRRFNRERRNKDSATDILSFSLTPTCGEIFLNPNRTQAKAKKFGTDYQNYASFLFIHGLLHLKGMDHGSTMEQAEKKLCKKFQISLVYEEESAHYHRD